MGIHREDGGYSASVEAFFVLHGQRVRLAKTNGRMFVLAESLELAPNTVGDLIVIVDGKQDSKHVKLPDGVLHGQTVVKYKVLAPF